MPADLLRRDPNIGALSKKARSGVSWRLRAGGSALMLIGLAGCGGDNAAQEAALKCPRVDIPRELSFYDVTRNNSINFFPQRFVDTSAPSTVSKPLKKLDRGVCCQSRSKLAMS